MYCDSYIGNSLFYQFTELYIRHCAQSLSHVQLFETPCTVAHQAPLSMGILQAKSLVWFAMPSSRGSSQAKDRTQIACIAGRFFTSVLSQQGIYSLTNGTVYRAGKREISHACFAIFFCFFRIMSFPDFAFYFPVITKPPEGWHSLPSTPFFSKPLPPM